MTLSNSRIYFNPPAPCGTGPASGSHGLMLTRNFNPPAPCGTGLPLVDPIVAGIQFQSTRPLRDGTECIGSFPTTEPISIHPPLAGRDPRTDICHCSRYGISIHPPLAGRDSCPIGTTTTTEEYFNPPAPCGTGPVQRRLRGRYRNISIHPPLAGRDLRPFHEITITAAFQSTRPLRDGTDSLRVVARIAIFQSTRPLRDGTQTQGQKGIRFRHFNPPAPCGTGRILLSALETASKFQSTRPLRDGTSAT